MALSGAVFPERSIRWESDLSHPARVFVSVGNLERPFQRLLEAVNREKELGELRSDKVIVQRGHTPFASANCEVYTFLDPKEFLEEIDRCDLLICHAGAGVLLQGLLQQKRIVAMPRLAALDEHLDDHQLDLATALADQSRITMVRDAEALGGAVREARSQAVDAGIGSEATLCRAVATSLSELG